MNFSSMRPVRPIQALALICYPVGTGRAETATSRIVSPRISFFDVRDKPAAERVVRLRMTNSSGKRWSNLPTGMVPRGASI